ncbi:MAG TPA: hypothetical protein P5104_08910, partial [Bacteroidales bacterium]|nr:hypothetical protein [Bacteroidales bacterium]
MHRKILFLLAFILLTNNIIQSDDGYTSKIDLSLAKEIDHSIKIGLKWLCDQQEEDGSWQHYPAISAL